MLKDSGVKLREWRTKNGDLSLTEMSKKLGRAGRSADPGHLSRIERGLVETISVDLAVAIQKLTGIPVESWRSEVAS